MKIIRNLNNNCLDFFIPDNPFYKTIVHFHGGGLVEGCKEDCEDLMIHLANKGFTMVNVNYPLYPNADFNDIFYAITDAVRFAYEHVEEYQEKRGKFYLSGQSAGAYIVMMLAMRRDLWEVHTVYGPEIVDGFISDSAQLIDHFNVQKYENGLDPWVQRISEYSPLYYVTPEIKCNPILLIYYKKDMLNRKEHNHMFYNLAKYYNPDLDIELVELKGQHVQGSCKVDKDGEYPYVKLLMKWMENR